MFHKSRQYYKLVSFSKRQSAVAHFTLRRRRACGKCLHFLITNLFLKKAKKKAEKEHKKIVLFFGDGTFSPGGTGYASVPKKTFIKQLGLQYPTLIRRFGALAP